MDRFLRERERDLGEREKKELDQEEGDYEREIGYELNKFFY